MPSARRRDLKRLPARGPLPRPGSPAEAREALRAEAFPSPNVQRITLVGTEFTSVCPRTGQPDFGGVVIEYVPGDKCLESRALKYYLWSYRDEGAFCETLAGRIADDVVYAVRPAWVKVRVHQNVRGGIAIVAEAERGRGRSR
ncbi:MAG TPA: preQ(1) synthase [Gemmatimonadales bacterium]|nr:preQ(1) synthase [Gemmatimonadales bacterium]